MSNQRNMGYEDRYPRVYRSLKRYGFTAFYALRILVEAERGETHALIFCRLVRSAK